MAKRKVRASLFDRAIVEGKKLWREPLYPFFFAFFPTLSLYSQNIRELLPEQVLPPLVFIFLVSLVIFFVLFKILKSKEKTGLIVFLLLLLIFNYGLVNNLLPQIHFVVYGLALGNNRLLFPLWFLIFGLACFLIIKKSFTYRTNLFNFLTLLLLLFPLFQIISFEINSQRFFGLSSRYQVNATSVENSSKVLKKPSDPPDIYYFIFDRYASFQNLKEFYDYENKDLADFLKEKGFYLARESRDNYPATFLSLASSLNLDYVDSLLPDLPTDSTDQTIVYRLIQNYKVEEYLRAAGYKFVNVGNWWAPTRANKNADKNYVFSLSKIINLNEFSNKLLETTIFSPIIQRLNKLDLDESYENFDHRNRILYGLASLKKVPEEIKGPKFVFGHILVPHAPYVLDKNCNPVKPEQTRKNKPVVNYLAQLECGNKNIQEIINNIFRNSKNSIVVLQADEGPAPIINKFSSKWNQSSVKSMKEKTGILNAYYFPDRNYKNLYQTITPVNSFRLIFNQYFGTNFKKLDDKVWIFEHPTEAPYKFHDVTSKVFD